MKTTHSFLAPFLFFALSAQADLNLKELAGSYVGACTQSQNEIRQGSIIETYSFSEGGNIIITQKWFNDSLCKDSVDLTSEVGTFMVGKELIEDGFIPAGTYQADYHLGNKTELGLIWIDSNYSKLRVSRAFGIGRNTMLGGFIYNRK